MSCVRSSFPVGSEVPKQKRHLPPKYVPNELIGAFNALTSCVRLPSVRRLQVVHAQSASALPALERPRRYEADLDFQAKLSIFVRILCVLCPPLVFWLVACATQGTLKPDTVVQRLLKSLSHLARESWLRWTWALLQFSGLLICSAASSFLLRYQLRERQYAQHQHPREQLADTDSLFRKVQGVSVHCKQTSPSKTKQQQPDVEAGTGDGGLFRIFSRRKSGARVAYQEADPEAQAGAAATAAIALYHGFGANLWSWMRIQQELADSTGATVVSHDMPGFGLTERVSSQRAYTLQTNGDIGRELAAEALSAGKNVSTSGTAEAAEEDKSSAACDDDGSSSGQSAQPRKPVVLVGHSLGAAGVASSFVHNPEGVDGIVLVAPAIIVSPFAVSPKLRSRKILSDESSHSLLEQYDLQPVEGTAAGEELPPDEQAWQARSVVGAALRRFKGLCVPLAFWVIRPAVFVVLRSLVRMKAFWERGLKSCYFDTAKLSSDIVYYYRLPQLMKGWEMGILRFLQARFMAEERWKSDDAVPRPRKLERSSSECIIKGDSLLGRFEKCVKDTGVPVLIIHGEQDTLVPIGNSCRLSAVIQAPLVKISGCGHTPAEELPDMFVAEVSRFVKESVWADVAPAELNKERRGAKS